MLSTVVAVGASAGGLKALTGMLASMGPLENAAMIVAQHSSPRHESLLPQLLAKNTRNPVEAVVDGGRMLPGHVYIVPPGYHCELQRGAFLLRDDVQMGPRPSIDRLFDSLANLEGWHVIGVVMSGTGSDGTRGLLSIKSQGGITIAQLPQSAEYESMPASAINQNAADIILPPEEIGRAVMALINKSLPAGEESPRETPTLRRILQAIEDKTRIDLSHYKTSTLQRRILRRANLSRAASMEDYCQTLENDPDELDALVNDIFISITGFKRDQKVWEGPEELIADYVQHQSRHLRIWSAGCSTGEEPYSIALLLESVRQRYQLEFDYQILATDISERVITQARNGTYDHDTLGNLGEAEVQQYFVQTRQGLQVSKSLRDRIIFSVHNVLVDPPFSKIDLVFCRNLLIYFNTILQERTLRSFGYSLKPGGLLVLGLSEAITAQRKLFEEVSSELKLFRRNNIAVGYHVDHYLAPLPLVAEPRKIEIRKTDYLGEIHLALGAAHPFESLLVSEHDEIVYKHGRCEPLTIVPEGRFSANVFASVHPRFRAALRAMCFKVRRTKAQVHFQESLEDAQTLMNITVTPSTEHEGWLVISQETRVLPKAEFQRLASSEPSDASFNQKLIDELESELNTTRESLQTVTVVEELETTNEELQSTNEELQSSNEELQATNEELQTTNEELQSSNEELHTVNEELRTKNEELQQISSDLQALEEALEVPYLLIGANGRVIKYSRFIVPLVEEDSLHVNDLFLGIQWRTTESGMQTLIQDAVRHSMESGKAGEHLIHFRDESTHTLSVRPYQNRSQKSQVGCLLILGDVSREFRQVREQTIARDKAYALLNALTFGVILTDRNGILTFSNRSARTLLDLPGHPEGQAFDKVIRLFSHPRQTHPEIGIFQSLTRDFEDGEFTPFDRRLLRQAGSELVYLDLSAKPSLLHDSLEQGWMITVNNVSSIISLNEKLQWAAYHDSLTGLANRRFLGEFLEQGLQQRAMLGSFVYAIIDLDKFKPINDTCGHQAGDEVLVGITQTIQSVIRKADVLARLGGDEFALLLPHTSPDNAAFIFGKLVKAVEDFEMTFGNRAVSTSVSIGWVSIDENTFILPTELYQQADQGVYEAKSLGGNRHVPVHGQSHQGSRRMQLLEDVRKAIQAKQIELVYQPMRPLRSGLCGYRYEALVRLKDRQGLMLPERFLDVADQYRLMPELDRVVIEHVFDMAKRHAGSAGCGLSVSINLSAQTLHDRSITEFIEHFDQQTLSGQCVTFEITETAAVQDLEDIRHFIEFAHRKGFKVALDDFGTSYHSFHLLKQLELDLVKIDGGFIRNVLDDPTDQAFLDTLVKISQIRGFRTVAEWVDRPELMQYLADRGVDYVQGHHIHPGLSESELIAELNQQQHQGSPQHCADPDHQMITRSSD